MYTVSGSHLTIKLGVDEVHLAVKASDAKTRQSTKRTIRNKIYERIELIYSRKTTLIAHGVRV